MESAIPLHLETQRTRHKRVPDDYQPPYPSFVARYKPAVGRVVMAYFGVQYRGSTPAAATEALAEVTRLFAGQVGPTHWDRAQYVDQAGYANIVSVAYWDDIARFDNWFAPAREAWTGKQRDGIGTFIEVLRPTVARRLRLRRRHSPRSRRGLLPRAGLRIGTAPATSTAPVMRPSCRLPIGTTSRASTHGSRRHARRGL